MPILDIDLVLAPGDAPVSYLAGRLADAASQIFGSEPRRTWVKLRFIETGLYAENGGLLEDTYPVFVTVLKSRLPQRDQLEDEVARLSKAVAAVCARAPENVHILYLPEAAGRMAFGGVLVE